MTSTDVELVGMLRKPIVGMKLFVGIVYVSLALRLRYDFEMVWKKLGSKAQANA